MRGESALRKIRFSSAHGRWEESILIKPGGVFLYFFFSPALATKNRRLYVSNRFPPFFDDNAFGIYQKILAGKIDFPRHLEFSVK